MLTDPGFPLRGDDPSLTHKMVKNSRLWGHQAGEVPAQGLLLSFYWTFVVNCWFTVSALPTLPELT